MESLLSLPFGYAVAALFVIVMLRANATYWLGRGAAAGARHTGLEKRLNSAAMRRAETMIARFGAPVVSLCFVTVGVQTAVNLAAGVGRMPLKRYLPAVVLGSVIWALLYATVGLAALNAWLAMVAGSPWAFILLAAAAAAVVSFVLGRRRRVSAAPVPEDLPRLPAPPDQQAAA